ncbi:MAG: hypothetical protein J5J06_07735 [Phycisphaerae bacterium]|nr:hypothetical protein [Phycisphaerae bacterium]
MSICHLRAATALLAVAACCSITWARPTGAGPGYSGGYQSLNLLGAPGQNCTQCHFFNEGHGTIELIGMPKRYILNRTYDLTVRVTDADQIGAGFEISVEDGFTYAGSLLLSDAVNTRFTAEGPFPPDTNYVTHSEAGYENSMTDWIMNGSSASFALQWQAPGVDQGEIDVFLAALATQRSGMGADIELDNYYAHTQKSHPTTAGDADADTDFDLQDWAALQNCLGTTSPLSEICGIMDAGNDGSVSLEDYAAWIVGIDGPLATTPGGYITANVIRGGLLYDRWWRVAGVSTPTGNHPLYPVAGQQSGSTTFRCKECHGWDYRGADGVYGSGTHFTGIAGIADTTLPAQAIFDLLKQPASAALPNGHNMAAYGLSDDDLWDLVKFSIEGAVDTRQYIGRCSSTDQSCEMSSDCPGGETCETGRFVGSQLFGSIWYGEACASCHDPADGIGGTGTGINFGSEANPRYVGTIAVDNPWEFLHKIRFGHPGSPMPSTDLLDYSVANSAELGAYAATLPTE